jgi:alpha-beta hydrolase superfamily lysophospholipase
VCSQEIPVSFSCCNERLYGVLHKPHQPQRLGVLIVHGRPATRVGKHRLFVLLARTWSEAGYPVMRFDYRGTGDSLGELMTFQETSDDIASAVEAFVSNMPGMEQVILWGLCGGAADALFYAPKDPRVVGAVLVNPWTYDARVRSLVKLRHTGISYLRRMFRSWVVNNDSTLPHGSRSHRAPKLGSDYASEPDLAISDLSAAAGVEAAIRAYRSYRAPDMSKRLAASLEKFPGRVLLILGGGDVGARTFKITTRMSLRWRRLLSARRVTILDLPGANHSLRLPQWRNQAAAWTLDWLKEL